MKTMELKTKTVDDLVVWDKLSLRAEELLREWHVDSHYLKQHIVTHLMSVMYEDTVAARDIIKVLLKATVPVIFDLWEHCGDLYLTVLYMATRDIEPHANDILSPGWSSGGWGAQMDCCLFFDKTTRYISDPILILRKPDPMKYLKYAIVMRDDFEAQDCDHLQVGKNYGKFEVQGVLL